eukprot:CAMPEP_0116874752 /NCGR_PEP_ID=MMETSP0463-20121206/6314_1 /TAXON_ID=181622 /ORGANISM="Strombidinopsis sp, Strain SopsisLIS2011" /LENGTH=119 /DNA_ID=CAMNT_0004518911 /DNA_START=852 /DNA_END=1211 /DNA_ORIENTATION=-
MSYTYKADDMDALEKSRTNKDIYMNTALHYSYLNDSVEFREVLLENEAANLGIMNRRGKNAKDYSHRIKWDSDDEEAPEDENEQEREERRMREFKNTPDYVFICRDATVHVIEKNLKEL